MSDVNFDFPYASHRPSSTGFLAATGSGGAASAGGPITSSPGQLAGGAGGMRLLSEAAARLSASQLGPTGAWEDDGGGGAEARSPRTSATLARGASRVPESSPSSAARARGSDVRVAPLVLPPGPPSPHAPDPAAARIWSGAAPPPAATTGGLTSAGVAVAAAASPGPTSAGTLWPALRARPSRLWKVSNAAFATEPSARGPGCPRGPDDMDDDLEDLRPAAAAVAPRFARGSTGQLPSERLSHGAIGGGAAAAEPVRLSLNGGALGSALRPCRADAPGSGSDAQRTATLVAGAPARHTFAAATSRLGAAQPVAAATAGGGGSGGGGGPHSWDESLPSAASQPTPQPAGARGAKGPSR